jgi:hypothetical protein
MSSQWFLNDGKKLYIVKDRPVKELLLFSLSTCVKTFLTPAGYPGILETLQVTLSRSLIF